MPNPGDDAGRRRLRRRIPAGWYPDPADQGTLRWWDGTGWTSHLTANPSAASPGADTTHGAGAQPGRGGDAAPVSRRHARTRARISIEPHVVAPPVPRVGTSHPTPSADELRRRVRAAHAAPSPASPPRLPPEAPRFRPRDRRAAGRAAYLRLP